MTKAKYRIKNWSSYNKSLVHRGSINLWISEEVCRDWFYCSKAYRNNKKANKKANKKEGHPFTYSNVAIELCLTVRSIYKMPLRMTEGFLQSILGRFDKDIECPDYSTISRRGKRLKIKLKRYQNLGNITDIAVDSTGLKVYGEGEWKVRQHKASFRRTWKKLHIAMDPLSHEVLATDLTSSKATDDKSFKTMIDQIPEDIERVFGDGAYDKIDCYNVCHKKGITPIIPPQKKALLQDEMQRQIKRTSSRIARDNIIGRIRELELITRNNEKARAEWKIESDYHTRSNVETTMFRYKKIFGDKLLSRNFDNQKTENIIKINLLNKFTSFGMPESWPIYG